MIRRMLFILFCLYDVISGEIILSEIMFNPAGPERSDEYIEIFNRSGSFSVDLNNWQIGDQDGLDMIIDAGEGTILSPGQYGIIFDEDYFNSEQSYLLVIPERALLLSIDDRTFGSGGLSNSRDETIRLVNAKGFINASFTYTADNSSGYSEEKIDCKHPDILSNWENSLAAGGTPGYKNSRAKPDFDLGIINFDFSLTNNALRCEGTIVNLGIEDIAGFNAYFFHDENRDSCRSNSEIFSATKNLNLQAQDTLKIYGEWLQPMPGKQLIGLITACQKDERADNNIYLKTAVLPFCKASLIINEIMAKPFPDDQEWIELFNPTKTSINLNGWQVSDQDTSDKQCITIQDIYIEPSQFIIISSAPFIELADSVQQIQAALPYLNNNSDCVYLFDPANNLIDYICYASVRDWDTGISLERIQYHQSSQDPQNWMASTDLNGATPGYRNSVTFQKLPEQCTLHIAPDPFSPNGDGIEDIVTIKYQVPVNHARVTLQIFDICGRPIQTLLSGWRSGAIHSVTWNGNAYNGNTVRMGIYIVFFQAIDDFTGRSFQKKATVILAEKL